MSSLSNQSLERNISQQKLPQTDLQTSVQQTPPNLIQLDRSHMEEVVALEQRSYPSPWSPDLVRGEFYKDISFRYGLQVDGAVAAYAFSYLIPEDLHLLNLAVAPEHRGKGFGKFLLCNVLSRGLLRGARLVTLEVRPSNEKARNLYTSLGFRQNGIRRNYYRDNGEDALLLERPMSPADLAFFERSSRASLKN